MPRILVGTQNGLHELDLSSGKRAVSHAGREVTDLSPEGRELWAILDRSEVAHTSGVDRWFRAGELDGLSASCVAHTRAGVVV
jgi:hypothetical protein